MTDRQPVVAVPLRADLRARLEKLRGYPPASPVGEWISDEIGHYLQWPDVLAALAVEAVRPETDIDEAVRVVRGAGYVVHADEGECYAITARCPTCGRHDCPGRYQWADCTTSEADLLAQTDNAEEERGDAR